MEYHFDECLKCGYVFTVGEDVICDGAQGSYCKACGEYSKIAVSGYNDLWTTNPEIAQMLLNPSEGYTHLMSSNDKTDWICPNCNTIIKNRTFAQVYYHGLACKKCGDGVSYPEKIMRECLEQSGLTFEMHKTFDWSNLKEYDFYLSDYNIIIETHGEQHYKHSFKRLGGMTLEDVQLNDKYKEKIAIENGINKYIIIDCQESDFDYIYENIELSELNTIINFELIDKNKVSKNSLTNYLINACELWNSGIKDIKIIAEKMKLSSHTIVSYLKRCDKIGLCDYTNYMKSKKTRIVKCKTTGEIFVSMTDACQKYNIQKSAIRKSCLNPEYSAGKLINKTKLYWEYVDTNLSNKI